MVLLSLSSIGLGGVDKKDLIKFIINCNVAIIEKIKINPVIYSYILITFFFFCMF
jgi:hypothetical protein